MRTIKIAHNSMTDTYKIDGRTFNYSEALAFLQNRGVVYELAHRMVRNARYLGNISVRIN